MTSHRNQHIKRILIRSANWVGDAIMTTPAIKAVRQNYPDAHITLLAKPWVVPVFEHNPHLNSIMVYDAGGRHKGSIGIMRLARDLKFKNFNLAILLQNAFEAALIVWLAGIRHRIGYTTDGRSLLLTQRIRSWRKLKKGHLVDYYRGLLTGAGLSAASRNLRLYLTPKECHEAEEILLSYGISLNTTIVGINPGATYGTAKRWPQERYAQLSKTLIREHGAQILIFGGPGEVQLGAEIAASVGKGCLNLCNRTSLRQAMALINCCHAFVSNDSGLMHVAAALDIPQTAIIGPTDPVATGPLSEFSRLVHNAGSCTCAPCLEPHCQTDHQCMTSIGVDTVYQATLERLQSRNLE